MNNRELKFRVWLHDTKEWGNVSCIEVFNSTGKLEYLYQDQPYTIQQYTGLKDKNGKEIYEGDILEYQSHDPKYAKCIVRWTQDHEDNHPGFVIHDSYSQYGKPEVVGDIFETKKDNNNE